MDNSYGTNPDDTVFWECEKDEAHKELFRQCRAIEEAQVDLRERIFKCVTLYDPYYAMEGLLFDEACPPNEIGPVTENVIAEVVDTATSLVAASAVKPSFQTDDADYTLQDKVKAAEDVTWSDFQRAKVHWHSLSSFKDGLTSGLGTVYCYWDGTNPRVERVHWDELIVDEVAASYSGPVWIARRKIVNRKILKLQWKEFADDIGDASAATQWTTYRRIRPDEIVIIEAHMLPVFDSAGELVKQGRRIVAIEGKTFIDKDYEYDYFPYVNYRWNEKQAGYWGKSLIEDLAGGQLKINRLNTHIDKVNLLINRPRILQHVNDLPLKAKFDGDIGQKIPWLTAEPKYWVPPPINQELYSEKQQTREAMYNQAGLGKMALHGTVPSKAIEAGVALREVRDQQSQRFSIQIQAWEEMQLQIAEIFVALRKKHSAGKKVVTSYGAKRKTQTLVDFNDIDIDDNVYTINLQATSILSKTPQGRKQDISDLVRDGIIDQLTARQLYMQSDFEKEVKVDTAHIRNAKKVVEQLKAGKVVVPYTYSDPAMCLKYVRAELLDARDLGAPAEIVRNMENYVSAVIANAKKAQDALLQQQQQQQMAIAQQQSPPPTQGPPQMQPPPGPPMSAPMSEAPPAPGGSPPMGAM